MDFFPIPEKARTGSVGFSLPSALGGRLLGLWADVGFDKNSRPVPFVSFHSITVATNHRLADLDSNRNLLSSSFSL